MRTRRLIVVTPEGDRELLFIGRLTLGRAPECDISLADTKISRRHAEFDASGPMPRVTDLGSRNGILVNGRKVGAADLMPGDIVTVGDASIRFEERPADAAEPQGPAAAAVEHTLILSPILPPPPPPAPVPVPVPLPPPVPVALPPAFTAPPASLEAKGGAPDPDWRSDPANTGPAAPRAAPPPAARVELPFDASGERTALLPPPRRPTGAANRLADAGPGPALRTAPPAAAPPVAPAPRAPAAPRSPAVPSSPPPVSSDEAAHAVAPAAPAAAAARKATGSAPQGPRFSWSALVTLAAALLGGLAVLLAALLLKSASLRGFDALSQRQAQTLAVWLATGVDPQANAVVDPRVMEAVLAQPGVARAMVLERATGRAVAPVALGGRAYTALPGLGETWRDLSSARVGRVDAFEDAYVPAGGGAYIAWVRYERPSSNDTGLAIMVALVATLVFAMLIALLIKRRTRATLQHFTRQVEQAVAGASPKVMQGTMMPGLERMAGLVTDLLEQRRAGGAMSAGGRAGLIDTHDPSLPSVAAPIDPGPPWLDVTPSLMVAAASAHGPQAGGTEWSNARGRHLLDVLDNGPVRNAVVQGLSALSMQPGSEATVPLSGAAPVALRRESSGHVRVTLGAR